MYTYITTERRIERDRVIASGIVMGWGGRIHYWDILNRLLKCIRQTYQNVHTRDSVTFQTQNFTYGSFRNSENVLSSIQEIGIQMKLSRERLDKTNNILDRLILPEHNVRIAYLPYKTGKRIFDILHFDVSKSSFGLDLPNQVTYFTI